MEVSQQTWEDPKVHVTVQCNFNPVRSSLRLVELRCTCLFVLLLVLFASFKLQLQELWLQKRTTLLHLLQKEGVGFWIRIPFAP